MEERPARSMVTMSSALSASSEVRMRERSVGSAGIDAFEGARFAPVVFRVRVFVLLDRRDGQRRRPIVFAE
jgi:hypothetical protein